MSAAARDPGVVITAALVEAIVSDPEALDELAAALAPRLERRAPVRGAAALTPAGAGAIAGLHARTIRRALAAGMLRGSLLAGRWRIDPEDLDEWLAAGAPTAPAPRVDAGGRSQRARSSSLGADAIAGRLDSVQRGA